MSGGGTGSGTTTTNGIVPSEGARSPQPINRRMARFLLVTTGWFGGHQMYFEKFPEAFVYLSTCGVALLAVLFDTFRLSDECTVYDDLRKHRHSARANGYYDRSTGDLVAPSGLAYRVVPFSISSFLMSTLYGAYLGTLCWMAGSLTFGRCDYGEYVMLLSVAAAITLGVYVYGNSGGESRDFFPIWFSVFAAYTACVQVCLLSWPKAVLSSAVFGTLLGNRGATYTLVLQRPFRAIHLAFWSSLFFLLMCCLSIGASQQILARNITITQNGQPFKTITLKHALWQRWSYPDASHDLFRGRFVDVHFEKFVLPLKDPWGANIFDRKPTPEAQYWIESFCGLIVDTLKADADTQEVLQYLVTRRYLITMFELTPLASLKLTRNKCDKLAAEESRKSESTAKDKALALACQQMFG